MGSLAEDLRHASRRLRRAPGFTLVASLTLALGIGGSAALLTAFEALLLRPLPWPRPEQLVLVHQTDARQPSRAVAPANFLDWRERASSFSGLAAYEVVGRTLVAAEGAHRLDVGIASANFFDVLGARAALGRTFRPAVSGLREVVLGEALFRERFGADPSVVGRDLQLDQELVRVVGVIPARQGFPREAELWLQAADDLPELPIALHVDLRTLRDSRYLGVVGRLRETASHGSAQAEMDGVAEALAREHPDANSGQGARVEPLRDALRGGARPAFGLLFGALACVMLVACANVANLLLARATARQQELAVRAALGASRARLARQLVAEALLVAGLGCLSGLALAWASRPVMLALWPASLPPLEGLRFSGTVLGGASLAALASLVLTSLVPARVAARADALAGLRASGRTPFAGAGARRLRGLVVVAEVALAVVLVSGAGLLLGALWRLQRAPLGFLAQGGLSARLDYPRALAQDAKALRAFAEIVEARLRGLPGVSAVAVGQALPLSGLRTSAGLRVLGREVAPNAQPDACWRLVSAGWHEALGIRVLRGRGFDARDVAGAPAVALVNATLARQVFAGEDPIGRRIATGLDGPEGTWVEIVGVMADTPQENVAVATRPELHRPLAQDVRMGPSGLSLVVRAQGDPLAFAEPVRRELAALRADVALSRVAPLEVLARDMVAAPRAAARVLGLFAGLALLLAALGLYGVVSCLVGEELRELGVRLALGARPASLVALVIERCLALAGAGLALGLLGALAAGRALGGMLYGISPHDPATLAAVCGVLLAVAAAAAAGPALRAARLDPARLLRGD